MSKPLFPSSLLIKSYTFTDDNPKTLTNQDIPFYHANFHAYTNPIDYGYGGHFDAYMNTGDVVWFTNGNLRDFMFKNHTAAANGKIVIIATVPTKFVIDALGL